MKLVHHLELLALLDAFAADPCEPLQARLADWLERHGDSRHVAVRELRVAQRPGAVESLYCVVDHPDWPEADWYATHTLHFSPQGARGEIRRRVLALFAGQDTLTTYG